jgi:hypothetical protein
MNPATELREIDSVNAPVIGLRAALDPVLFLETVHDPARRGLLDFHHVGELRLAHTGPPVDAGERQPLRARQPEVANAAGEDGTQQPSRIRCQPAEL